MPPLSTRAPRATRRSPPPHATLNPPPRARQGLDQPPLVQQGLDQPPLVQQLVALGLAVPGAEGAAAPAHGGPSLAERLAPWLAWTDAIALAGALDATPPPAAPAAQASAARRQARTAAEAVRRTLADAIERDHPDGLAADDLPADASPGRRYRAHQQAMEARIAALRAQVRRALAAQSPALGRIAVLDRLLEQALAARERQLLSALPAWLDRRLQRDPAPPAELTRPLLHAELAHRLQPVDGMLGAMEAAGMPAPAAPARAEPRP